MAQRKSTPSGKNASGKTTAAGSASAAKANGSAAKANGSKVSTSKPASKAASAAPTRPASKAAASKSPASRAPVSKATAKKAQTAAATAAARKSAAGRPPTRKGKSKSIVNQKQTPWGLIAATVAVVVFAAAVVIVVVATHKSSVPSKNVASDAKCTKQIGSSKTTYLNELVCAKNISGVTFKQEANRNHVTGTVKYDSTPPVGGNHNGFWADCTGTVYSKAIANENAVHMLEHGAIWITYNADDVKGAQLDELKSYVAGNDRMALSPYPGLKTPISMQAWGYQLFLNKASDPRIPRFIAALKYNPKTTPEYGASCSNPQFKDDPSTFGHPRSS